MGLLALIQMVLDLLELRRQKGKPADPAEKREINVAMVLATVALFALYIFCLSILGFIISTILFCLCRCFCFRWEKTEPCAFCRDFHCPDGIDLFLFPPGDVFDAAGRNSALLSYLQRPCRPFDFLSTK
jgi:hypothetical protein